MHDKVERSTFVCFCFGTPDLPRTSELCMIVKFLLLIGLSNKLTARLIRRYAHTQCGWGSGTPGVARRL